MDVIQVALPCGNEFLQPGQLIKIVASQNTALPVDLPRGMNSPTSQPIKIAAGQNAVLPVALPRGMNFPNRVSQ